MTVARNPIEAPQGPTVEFAGDFSRLPILEIGRQVSAALDAAGIDRRVRTQTVRTVMELASNVIFYAAADSEDPRTRPGHLALYVRKEEVRVVSENPVLPEQAAPLQERLAEVAAMSPEHLTTAYRARLRGEDHGTSRSESRGAGLGILAVARAARGSFRWELHPRTGDPRSTVRIAAVLR